MTRRPSGLNSASSIEAEFLEALRDLLRQDGWEVVGDGSLRDTGADLVISRGAQRYVVTLKVSREGRRDRLVALISQAILQATAAARASNGQAAPLAIVAAPLITQRAADELMNFLAKFVPDAAAGIFDPEGLRRFVGPGLETLVATPKRSARREKLRVPDSANLFSDLNQWLLKVLLAPLVPEDLLHAPRENYRNASELAKAAEVSVMSSFRFLRQLEEEGYLDDESEWLRLVQRQDLMSRWRAAYRRPVRELPLIWIDPVKTEHPLLPALRAYNGGPAERERPEPLACLGLSGAAEALGFGPFPEVRPTFYLKQLDREALVSLGLSAQGAEYRPDVIVRVPVFRESIFRAAVIRDGVPVADILQVWLDISSSPACSEAQAEEIRHRALTPIFTETPK
jgi:hypothetical protein